MFRSIHSSEASKSIHSKWFSSSLQRHTSASLRCVYPELEYQYCIIIRNLDSNEKLNVSWVLYFWLLHIAFLSSFGVKEGRIWNTWAKQTYRSSIHSRFHNTRDKIDTFLSYNVILWVHTSQWTLKTFTHLFFQLSTVILQIENLLEIFGRNRKFCADYLILADLFPPLPPQMTYILLSWLLFFCCVIDNRQWMLDRSIKNR